MAREGWFEDGAIQGVTDVPGAGARVVLIYFTPGTADPGANSRLMSHDHHVRGTEVFYSVHDSGFVTAGGGNTTVAVTLH